MKRYAHEGPGRLDGGGAGMSNMCYGSWYMNTNRMLSTVEATVEDALDCWPGVDIGAVTADYRAAINAALPEGLMLCGDQFYGPAVEPESWLSPDVPRDEDGCVDIAAIVDSIDFWGIVVWHDRGVSK